MASQKNTKNTVEEHLFKALVKLHLIQDRKTCNYSLCGRTDKGVSALSNVFSVTLRSRSHPKAGQFEYTKMINCMLPNDIRILASTPVLHHFDARFSCLYREYKYYFVVKSKNLEAMAEAAQGYVGVHDFRNFCKDDAEKKRSTERRILSFDVTQNGDIGVITVVGYSFLWHQVRCMVSVLFRIGDGIEDTFLVQKMLAHRGQKPQYELASEIGLVLNDCGFETALFQKDFTEDALKSLISIQEDLLIKTQVVNSITEGFGQLQTPKKAIKKIRLKD